MLTEDEGVKAIQFLLTFFGKSEPEEVSRRNWKNMQDWEKESTEQWYKMIKEKVMNDEKLLATKRNTKNE